MRTLAVRLIFLSQSFPPAHTPRAVQIARLLQHLRRSVTVLCCTPEASDPGFGIFPVEGEGLPADVEVIRLPRARWDRPLVRLLNRLAPELLRRPDRERFWSRRAARRLLHGVDVRRDDVLVSFSSPVSDHLAALQVKRRTGCRWIAAFSDPWIENPLNRLAGRSLALARRWEEQVFQNAERLIFTSAETVDRVMAAYPTAWRDKCRIVEHAWAGLAPGDHAPAPRLLLRHLGNLYGDRSAGPLLAGLAELARLRPGVLARMRIELIGHCERAPETFPDYQSLPVGTIVARPPVSYREALAAMREADLLLVLDAPGQSSPFLPSKLVEYFGAGAPIAALTPPGTSARLLREAGGWVADPGDPEGVARMLVQAADGARDPEAWRSRSASVRARFAPQRIAGLFAAIVDELVG